MPPKKSKKKKGSEDKPPIPIPQRHAPSSKQTPSSVLESTSIGSGEPSQQESRTGPDRTELSKFWAQHFCPIYLEVQSFKGFTSSEEYKVLRRRLTSLSGPLEEISDHGLPELRVRKNQIKEDIKNTLFSLQCNATEDDESDADEPLLSGVTERSAQSDPRLMTRDEHLAHVVLPQCEKNASHSHIEDDQHTGAVPVQLLSRGALGVGFKFNEPGLRAALCHHSVRDLRVALVSVVGAPRSGRSFLINLILQHLASQGNENWVTTEASMLEGFPWGKGENSLTSQVLLWPKPFIFGDLAIFLLDWESCFCDDLDQNDTQLMLTLASLISTILVFNVNETPLQLDDASIKFLQSVVLKLMAETGDEPLNRIMYVVRDANTAGPAKSHSDPNTCLGLVSWARAFQVLCSLQGDDASELGAVQVISTALSYKQKEFFLLPHPIAILDRGVSLEAVLRGTNPSFVKLVRELVEQLLRPEQLTAQRIAGREMRAHEFPALMSALVHELQRTGVTPRDVLNAIAGLEQERAQRLALESYDREVDLRIHRLHSAQDMLDMHEEVTHATLSLFDATTTFGGQEIALKYRDHLQQDLASRLELKVRPSMQQISALQTSLEQTGRQVPARYHQLMAAAMPGLQTLQAFKDAHSTNMEASMDLFDKLVYITKEYENFAKPFVDAAFEDICSQHSVLEEEFVKRAQNQLAAIRESQISRLETMNVEGVAHGDALALFRTQMQELLQWKDDPPSEETVQATYLAAKEIAEAKFMELSQYGDPEKIGKCEKQLQEDMILVRDDVFTDVAMDIRNQRIVNEPFSLLQYMSGAKKANYAIGIDLGTINSCAMVFKDRKVVPIVNKIQKRTTPSMVYFGMHEIVVGEQAKSMGFEYPANCISEVKRIIGKKFNDPVVVSTNKMLPYEMVDINGQPQICVSEGEKKCWMPEEVTAELLKELKHQAEVQLCGTVDDAVVTIPAYFTELQRDATKRACDLAGLNVLLLLNEPTAAAMAYGLQTLADSVQQNDKHRLVLVFDLGGGTCDVSILEMRGGHFVVKASRGDNKLGGEDYDDRLVAYLTEKLEREAADLELDAQAKRRLRHAVEFSKCELTYQQESRVILENLMPGTDVNEILTRSLLERLTKDLSERTLVSVQDCLQDAGLNPQDIDVVVVVGGSSCIPKVQELLREFFLGKLLYTRINPNEAIARGAALQAALITGKCKEAINVQDITPFSLGVRVENADYSIIIKKNSVISCESTRRFSTTRDYQLSVGICVYQGEDTESGDDTFKLGEFTLLGLKRARAGVTQCDVTFRIDENGILHVTAMEVGKTKNKKTITINKTVNFKKN